MSAFRRNALNLDSNIIVAERESNVMSILDTVACSMLLYVLALIDFARLELTRVPLTRAGRVNAHSYYSHKASKDI